MAHHIYKTKAFVIDAYGVGEGHLYVTFLTYELGLIRAMVRSARTLQSRLRYHVQPMSFGEYSFVRGREQWRLTGARVDRNFYHELQLHNGAVHFLGRFCALLRRLLAGEGGQQELFLLTESMLVYLCDEKPQGEVLENLEYVVVLRMLLLLGYIGAHRALQHALTPTAFTTEMLEDISPLRRAMAQEINRALHESHL